MLNERLQVQQGVEVPHGGESVDNAGAGHGPHRKDVHLRAGHLLLLRRAELAQGGEGVLLRLQQAGGQARHEPEPAPQLMKSHP